jgi:hemin uptake protein HemP
MTSPTKQSPNVPPLTAIADPSAAGDRRARQPGRRLDSRVLFDGGNELLICHLGEIYHLRETRQHKLILTK